MDIELGICDVCKEQSQLSRKYYYYDVKCDCCGSKEGNHFQCVRHCANCEPKAPEKITIYLKPIKL